MARRGTAGLGNTRPGAVSGTIFRGAVGHGLAGRGSAGRGWAWLGKATTLSGVRQHRATFSKWKHKT